MGTTTHAARFSTSPPAASDAPSRCMTIPHVRQVPWAFILALAAFASTVQSGTATAQFFDPFSQFFAPQAPVYAPPPAYYAPPVVSRRGLRDSRRARAMRVWVSERPSVGQSRGPERARHASVPVRIRHTSLPDPVPARTRRTSGASSAREKVRDESKTKPVPREPTGDPVAALLNDSTLRRGDVVILPDGPKVFKGGPSTPHRLRDFEEVHRTKLVGEKTRRQLTAMAGPVPGSSRPR